MKSKKINKIKTTILLTDAPFSSHSGYDAYQFAKKSLVEKTRKIQSIFFFSDSVYLANNLAQIAYDEYHLAQSFLNLNETYKTQLLLCIGAAQKRGIVNSEMANQKNHSPNVFSGFDLVGLVYFYQSVIKSNELVIFKNNQTKTISFAKQRVWVFYPATLPYQNLYFREIFELALAIASFTEKVYFVLDDEAKKDLIQSGVEYSKNITKMLNSAQYFSIDLIDKNKYLEIKNQTPIIELN